MKCCELCKSAARMYCESDQASLCWDCDAKVHSANFIVARHSRSLLCHVCQSPTPWNASGARLGRTVSVCESCVDGCEGVKENRGREQESEAGNDNGIDAEDDEYDDDHDHEDDEDDEEISDDDDDGDNQVVPWSSNPPPPSASSSSNEESSSRFCYGDGAVSLKQLHENVADLRSDVEFLDDLGFSSSHQKNCSPQAPDSALSARDSEVDFVDSARPLKRRIIEPNWSATVKHGPACSRTAIVESLMRFHEQDFTFGNNMSTAIVGICKLSKNPGSIDSDPSE